MNGRVIFRVVAVVVVILALAGIGTYVYNAGVSEGIARGDALVAAGDGQREARGGDRFYAYGGHHGPFGFGLFGILFTILLLFLLFGLLRAAFGWGRWGGGPPGRWGPGGGPGGPPEHWRQERDRMFEEWHRRAHAGSGSPQGGSPGAPPAGATQA